MVEKTMRLANLPELSTIECAARAAAWLEDLMPEIPLDRLPEVFAFARRRHRSTYPINSHEILQRWDEIVEKEKAESAASDAEDKLVNRVKHCSDFSNHVDDEGNVLLLDPFNPPNEIKIPCGICRPKANNDALLKHRRAALEKGLQVVSFAMPKFKSVREGAGVEKVMMVCEKCNRKLFPGVVAGGEECGFTILSDDGKSIVGTCDGKFKLVIKRDESALTQEIEKEKERFPDKERLEN